MANGGQAITVLQPRQIKSELVSLCMIEDDGQGRSRGGGGEGGEGKRGGRGVWEGRGGV